MTSKKISNKLRRKLAKTQKKTKPSTDELLFHPEIQDIFIRCISLIRNDEKDSAINMLMGLRDFSMETWKAKVETEPDKWVMVERPVGLQFFFACIAIIKRRINPYNIWLQNIMYSWFTNCKNDGVISEETYLKFLKVIGREEDDV